MCRRRRPTCSRSGLRSITRDSAITCFPDCFVCGPERRRGDGLRIFPGMLETGIVAAPWLPGDDLDGGDGKVAAIFHWAALDCPGYFAVAGRNRLMLLGEMHARVDRRVHVGEAVPRHRLEARHGWPQASGRHRDLRRGRRSVRVGARRPGSSSTTRRRRLTRSRRPELTTCARPRVLQRRAKTAPARPATINSARASSAHRARARRYRRATRPMPRPLHRGGGRSAAVPRAARRRRTARP